MEDEIDLREYAKALLQHGKLIAGLTVATVLAAWGLSWRTPPLYQAAAVLTASSGVNITPVITSDAVLDETIAELGPALPAGLASHASLLPMLTVSQATNSTSFQLIVMGGNAAQTAAIANAWADASAQQFAGMSVLNAQIFADRSLLENCAANLYALDWAKEDAGGLRAKLTQRNSGDPASMEDEIVLWNLASVIQSSFAASGVPNTPLLVGMPSATTSSRTVGDQIKEIDSLLAALPERRSILNERIQALQKDMQDAQIQTAPIQTPNGALLTVEVTQKAAVPVKPVSPQTSRNLVLGAALGFIAGILIAWGWEWQKKNSRVKKGKDDSR